MKKILLCLFWGALINPLFSEESCRSSLDFSKVKVQVTPYIYGLLFQPGYGVSFRTELSAHTFEFAPMYSPPTAGFFGNSSKRVGVTFSYYYTFRKGKVLQPYLGGSFTHERDLHRTTYYDYDGRNSEPYRIGKDPIDQESFVSSLIGLQLSSSKIGQSRGLSTYLFVDVLAPIGFEFDYGIRPITCILPRMGIGLRF